MLGSSSRLAGNITLRTSNHEDVLNLFSLPLLLKAKRSVGDKESGLDMLRPKIKYSLKLSYDDDKICTFVISTVNTC